MKLLHYNTKLTSSITHTACVHSLGFVYWYDQVRVGQFNLVEYTAQTKPSNDDTMTTTSIWLFLGVDSFPLLNNGLVEREDTVIAAQLGPASAVSSHYCFVSGYVEDKLKALQRNSSFKDSTEYQQYIHVPVLVAVISSPGKLWRWSCVGGLFSMAMSYSHMTV